LEELFLSFSSFFISFFIDPSFLLRLYALACNTFVLAASSPRFFCSFSYRVTPSLSSDLYSDVSAHDASAASVLTIFPTCTSVFVFSFAFTCCRAIPARCLSHVLVHILADPAAGISGQSLLRAFSLSSSLLLLLPQPY
jgi:hypothetical protein